VLLLDAAAALAVGDYLLRGQPRQTTPVAFHDHSAGRAHYCTVPVATNVEQLLNALAVSSANSTLRVSDPLRDMRISPDYLIDQKELTLHRVSPPDALINPNPCIRCSWCIEGCPTRIQPAALLEAAQRRNINLAKQHGIHACIECGICSYVCPSQLPLLPSIRELKQKMLAV
jgi:electron transport complex protein RnfC